MNTMQPAGEPAPVNPGALAAVEAGVNEAAAEANQEAIRREQDEVANLWRCYEQAWKFDEPARAQYALDRLYISGDAKADWAVSANLIGSFADILVSFLYARNPDVSIKKPERVDNRGTSSEDDFAKTLQIVISALWKSPNSRFKQMLRRQVRSALSVGVGWIKVVLVCKDENVPQMQKQLDDLRQNISDLEALTQRMQDPTYVAETTSEQVNADLRQKRDLEQSLTRKLEVGMRKMLAIDFVPPEEMQVALNVREITDYTNADWVSNRIYKPMDDLGGLFPRLTNEDIKTATQYFQRSAVKANALREEEMVTGMVADTSRAKDAHQFTTDVGGGANEQGMAFACVVELWNKRTGHVYTMVDGVKRWAREPYQPAYPSSRFYPYFGLAFYEVDGKRHPQSLAYRMRKLQDEYSEIRSSFRLTRKRATPGVLFDEGELGPEYVNRLTGSTAQEFIGLKPTTANKPLRDLFAEKPVSIGDIRLYDTLPIIRDMEIMSGVQEALQQGATGEKTATEAEIEQAGFASRTTADRDCLETMLTDLAQYTAEVSLSGLTVEDAQRMAGAGAFWPQGMAVDDLLTMAEVSIEAGTTGRPKRAADREAWGITLPILEKLQVAIRQAQMMDPPLADAMSELLRETMSRLGDDTDPERFIPKMPQMVAPPMGAGLPAAPGMPADPGAPGGAPIGPGGPAPADAAANGDPAALVPPDLLAQNLAPPEIAPPV